MTRICKVLIVEDYAEVRELLSGIFELAGYEFATVGTGSEMREELAANDYDIVVIDIGLPGGEDGFMLAEAAKAPGRGVILTTGDHRLVERLAASGHHHLLKPFAMRELVDLAERALAAAQASCVRRQFDGQPLPTPVT
jgi:DNA-binding response OmpR family regulator